jgi:hypothetical protein
MLASMHIRENDKMKTFACLYSWALNNIEDAKMRNLVFLVDHQCQYILNLVG